MYLLLTHSSVKKQRAEMFFRSVFINVNKLCIEKLTKSIFINAFQVLQKITYLCTILFAFLVKSFQIERK